MCAPLCEAVTGDVGARERLAEAFRTNLFMVALDDRGHWFRYHHLLRDLLRRELARLDPERRPSPARARVRLACGPWQRRGGDPARDRRRAVRRGARADRS